MFSGDSKHQPVGRFGHSFQDSEFSLYRKIQFFSQQSSDRDLIYRVQPLVLRSFPFQNRGRRQSQKRAELSQGEAEGFAQELHLRTPERNAQPNYFASYDTFDISRVRVNDFTMGRALEWDVLEIDVIESADGILYGFMSHDHT
jgi:hypothetical protein